MKGTNEGTVIEVLYYPTEYSIEKSVSYSGSNNESKRRNKTNQNAKSKLDTPFLEYNGGNPGVIRIELFYDTYGQEIDDVRTYTDKISDLMKIDPKLHAPPILEFIWGIEKQGSFVCVLESLSKKFTMFTLKKDYPIPVRARLSLTLKEFKLKFDEGETTKSSPDKTKVHVTQRGDSLWLIANKAYGNPKLWRPIADRNGIKNPRFLEPGKELIIPPLE